MFLLKLTLLLSGLMVLAAKNPVHSVLFLILAFCNGSVYLLLLGMEFLAITFLVVYAGAVAVLFLFIVMMLNLKILEFRQTLLNHYPVGVGLLLLLLLEGGFNLVRVEWSRDYLDWPTLVEGGGNLHLLGSVLYTHFYLPFLLAGGVLLVAMIGSILLTFLPPSSRRQSIYEQTVRSNRVRLLP